MSTWISKALAALALALAMAGAADAKGLRIVPPAGYCIVRDSGVGQGVVLMGRCSGVANKPPAILTAAIGAAGSGIAVSERGAELAAFFTSERGLAALSRNGHPRNVQVLEARTSGDAFLIRLRDVGPGGQGQAESWRAVLGLEGRLVTLTATGTAAAPLDRDAGRKVIAAFVKAMAAANR